MRLNQTLAIWLQITHTLTYRVEFLPITHMEPNSELEVLEPPRTLGCTLKPYQKQALFWMSEIEYGSSVREEILADAMGLGKTVMTIALILARRGKGYPKNERVVMAEEDSKVKGFNGQYFS